MDIIFDIDGTLADIEHRRHHVETKPKNWKAFSAAAHLDACHDAIATLARSLHGEHRIILCTGRGEPERAATEAWLKKHDIPYAELYMRAANDFRADDIIKLELLKQIRADGFDPKLVFEDRARVVAMWRAWTCLRSGGRGRLLARQP